MRTRLLLPIVLGTGVTISTIPATAQNTSELVQDCPECPEMVVIPAGRFIMGSPAGEAGRSGNEGPQREVRISDSFALGKYEVTKSELEAFVKQTGLMIRGCRVLDGRRWRADDSRTWRDPGFPQGERHPAVCVNWEDAKKYVEWLSHKTGNEYRLPSESEWEYAVRAGTTAARFWGDDPAGACTYADVADRMTRQSHPAIQRFHACEDGFVYTAPVGSFRANPFGLHDMLGNVWEWVEDCWNPSYVGAPEDGKAWTSGDCTRHVVRGGSWGLAPEGVRSAERNWFDVPNRSSVLGFRVARTLPTQ